MSCTLTYTQNRYSVASNFNPIKSSKVDLVVSVVDYQAPDGSQRHGLCTRYLKGTEVGSKVYCIFKKSLIFKRAMEVNRPLILIANGSGESTMPVSLSLSLETLANTFILLFVSSQASLRFGVSGKRDTSSCLTPSRSPTCSLAAETRLKTSLPTRTRVLRLSNDTWPIQGRMMHRQYHLIQSTLLALLSGRRVSPRSTSRT